MITSKELKDALKLILPNIPNWYSGSMLEAIKENVILVKPYGGITPTINTLGNTGRNNTGFTVLVHWNKSSYESELKAEEVLNQLKQIKVPNKIIKQVEFTSGHAIPLGTDDRGIFEFVINLFILEEV